jgi:hypothetical protein
MCGLVTKELEEIREKDFQSKSSLIPLSPNQHLNTRHYSSITRFRSLFLSWANHSVCWVLELRLGQLGARK